MMRDKKDAMAPQPAPQRQQLPLQPPRPAALFGEAAAPLPPFAPGLPAPAHSGWVFDRADAAFALVAYLLGDLFLRLVPAGIDSPNAQVSLFTLLYMAAALGYAKRCGVRPGRAAWGWGAALLAFGGLFALGIPEDLGLAAVVFLAAAAVYWTLALFGARVEGRLSARLFTDLGNGLFRLPFGHFSAGFLALGRGFQQPKQAKGENPAALGRLVGLLLTLLLLPLVLVLLSVADAGFGALIWRGVGWLLPDGLELSFLRLMLAVPVGLYLFALFWAARRGRAAAGPRRAGRLPLSAALLPGGSLLAAYLVFLVRQLPYFFSAFSGLLPAGFTYADYARQGFFELIVVAAINLGLLLFLRRWVAAGGQRPLARRMLAAALCGATLLLLATAARKLLLYIEAYGLSVRRLWAGWAMLLIAAAVLLAALGEWVKLPLTRTLALCLCGWFFLLCIADPSGAVLRYNYNAWQAGQLQQFDPWAAGGAAALPTLRRLAEETEEGELKDELLFRVELEEQELAWQSQRGHYTLRQLWALQGQGEK